MKIKALAALVFSLWSVQCLQAQYTPIGSPQRYFQAYGGDATACPYLFMGAFRVYTPFYLKSTNMLLDATGDLIWYAQSPTYAMDFKLHPNGRMAYNDNRMWHILDSTFAEVDSVVCVGYRNDVHEMIMTTDGHYFLTCLEDSIMDLSTLVTPQGFPGSTQGRVDAVVIQELDGAKNVVQEWHGLDHYAITDPDTSYFYNPSLLELTHTNSIDFGPHGKLLLSHRALNEISQIDWATGQIDWHLGGKRNEFDLQGDLGTKGQHDARYLPNGHITAWDNGNLLRPGRALEYVLDTVQMLATVVWQYANPAALSDAMGSYRRLADGSGIVGFGRVFSDDEPVVSLIAADDSKVFDIRFLDSSSTFRAICTDLPWSLSRPRLDCQVVSGQVVLGVDEQHLTYEWTTGEHTATIVVADTGWYQAFVPRGIGMMSTPPVHITDLNNGCLALPSAPWQPTLPRHQLLGRYDLMGRNVDQLQTGQIYIERYSDGRSRKLVWLR